MIKGGRSEREQNNEELCIDEYNEKERKKNDAMKKKIRKGK